MHDTCLKGIIFMETDEEQQLLEKYRQLSVEGRIRVNNQIDCELRVDAEAVMKRREKIETAKKAGVHYGRPKKESFPENWDVVYNQWKIQDITAKEAADKLQISLATLYRLQKKMKKNFIINENDIKCK